MLLVLLLPLLLWTLPSGLQLRRLLGRGAAAAADASGRAAAADATVRAAAADAAGRAAVADAIGGVLLLSLCD